jgi:hypothetical protein
MFESTLIAGTKSSYIGEDVYSITHEKKLYKEPLSIIGYRDCENHRFKFLIALEKTKKRILQIKHHERKQQEGQLDGHAF